jgi:hypothetical protein
MAASLGNPMKSHIFCVMQQNIWCELSDHAFDTCLELWYDKQVKSSSLDCFQAQQSASELCQDSQQPALLPASHTQTSSLLGIRGQIPFWKFKDSLRPKRNP